MSNEMAVGFLLGALLFSFFGWAQHAMYQRILVLKANALNRTAEKIGDRFYYIVPEEEYNR